MLRVSTLSADAGLHEQSEMETVVSQLANEGYSPIIRNMIKGGFNAVKLPDPDRNSISNVLETLEKRHEYGPGMAIGEIFFKDGVILTLNSTYELLTISITGFEQECSLINKFSNDVERIIKDNIDKRRVRGMQFNWKPSKSFNIRSAYRYASIDSEYETSIRSREDELNFQIPSYTADDLKASNFLSNEKNREFMVRLAKLVKMTEKDVERELSKRDLIQDFIQLGLAAEEYLLTCKQDQHTICFMSSKEQLTNEPMSSLRCTSCGRGFSEENIKEIFTITDRGRTLVNSSMWMSIWITELLIKNGIKKEAIRWRLEANGEELDILILDFDSRIFLELKDREFGLGDAYPFAYRVNRYGGTLGAIATTNKVAQDAKKFLSEERKRGISSRLSILEGVQGIESGVKQMIRDLSMIQVRRLARPTSEMVGFSLSPIIELWANKKLFKQSHEVIPEPNVS